MGLGFHKEQSRRARRHDNGEFKPCRPAPRLMTEEQAANYLEIPGLLELCCKQASRSLEEEKIANLPQELRDMIRVEAAHDLIEDIGRWKVVGAYLVCGGIRSERRAKVAEIAYGHKKPFVLSDDTRHGIYLCEGDEVPEVDMDGLSKIANAGELIGNTFYGVISLPKCNRPDLVSCSISGEKTRIVILEVALGPDPFFRGQYVIPAAGRALESELEGVHTRTCTITWPEDSRDTLSERRIPKAVKILKVRGLRSAFGGPVPTRWRTEEELEFEDEGSSGHPEVNTGHWIHKFVRRFQSLDKLVLEHISGDDLTNLRDWLKTTEVLTLSGQ